MTIRGGKRPGLCLGGLRRVYLGRRPGGSWGETVLAQSYYPREGLGTEESPGWERSAEHVRHFVEFYPNFVAPYSYPNAINIAGRPR